MSEEKKDKKTFGSMQSPRYELISNETRKLLNSLKRDLVEFTKTGLTKDQLLKATKMIKEISSVLK